MNQPPRSSGSTSAWRCNIITISDPFMISGKTWLELFLLNYDKASGAVYTEYFSFQESYHTAS